MTPGQVVRKATTILALLGSGCFVVIGELPEPAERGSAGSSGGSAGSGGAGGTSATGGSAGSSGGAGGGAGASGATGDAGTNGGSGGGGGNCCDCDGDQVESQTCGGTDCDDDDSRVKPGQTLYFGVPSATVGWDYDCSGEIEVENETITQCGLLGLGAVCTNQPQGWLAAVPPPCGDTGRWGKCRLGLVCSDDVIDANKIMNCH